MVDSIIADGGTATFLEADLAAGTTAITELSAAALDIGGGRLDILVNNAAMLITPSPTADLDEQLIDGAFAVNVRAAILLTGLIAPGMVERGEGAIINMGSINGLIGLGGSALYSATKATIHSLTKSWADEYGPFGVRVNTVAPGPTSTAKVAAMAEHLAPIIARIPSRRANTTDEVARAVLFLAGEIAGNINGAILSVDGGWSAI